MFDQENDEQEKGKLKRRERCPIRKMMNKKVGSEKEGKESEMWGVLEII